MVFPSSKKAFTLVELLVVIAIVGLLSTIVLAVTSGVSEQGRIAKGLQFSKHLENSLGDHLVGRWTFDETVDLCGTNKVCDTSGWDNHGTMNNFVFPYGLADDDTPSGQGKVVSFDGTDDYVGLDSVSPTDQGTIEMWIKLVAHHTGAVSLFFNRSNVNGGIDMYIDANCTLNISNRYGGDPTNYYWNINVASAVILNKWYHIIVSHNNVDPKLYINGEYIKAGGGSDSSKWLIYNGYGVGGHGVNSSWWKSFTGSIDEVRIYSTALTASQIQSQYYVGLQNLLTKGQITEQEYSQRLAVK